jgi:hypothetical protein
MIYITRTATIAPGKTGDALAFAHNIAKLLKDKHNMALEVMMPVGGNPNRIGWLGRYENLAQWEALVAKLLTDADYMEAVAKAKDTFLPGTVNDDIWRTI